MQIDYGKLPPPQVRKRILHWSMPLKAQMSTCYIFMAEIFPMLHKYEVLSSNSALFINEKLTLYGGLPTLDKLIEADSVKLKSNRIRTRIVTRSDCSNLLDRMKVLL